jgi:hypothetical protein
MVQTLLLMELLLMAAAVQVLTLQTVLTAVRVVAQVHLLEHQEMQIKVHQVVEQVMVLMVAVMQVVATAAVVVALVVLVQMAEQTLAVEMVAQG